MKLVKLGTIFLDGSKIKANTSKHKALSHGHIEKLEAQLREDVQALLAKAKIAERVKERDQQALQDHVDNVARRDAERTVGKTPRGKESKAPETGPKATDQINQSDRRRIPHHAQPRRLSTGL